MHDQCYNVTIAKRVVIRVTKELFNTYVTPYNAHDSPVWLLFPLIVSQTQLETFWLDHMKIRYLQKETVGLQFIDSKMI